MSNRKVADNIAKNLGTFITKNLGNGRFKTFRGHVISVHHGVGIVI